MSTLLPEGVYTGLRVLIAEDSTIHSRLARQWLEMVGCTTDVVRNGREAVEAFQQGRYDLILMDCRMPFVDGYAATRLIRALERERGEAPPVPIVALTAWAHTEDRARCLALGMSEYLVKPMRPEILQRVFDRFFPTRALAS